MSILGTITNKPATRGQRIVVAGVEKVGKTTFAIGAPNVLYIPFEMGLAPNSDVARIPKIIETFEETIALLDEITAQAMANKFPFQTIVVDSVTAVERLIHDYVLRCDPKYNKKNNKDLSMTSAHGGYGKAYEIANQHFERILGYFDAFVIHRAINVVLTCHVAPTVVLDPNSGEFHMWDLLLHSPKNGKTYGKREILTQWADMVGFLYEPVFVSKAGEGERLSRAVSQNKGRVLGVQRTPSYVAGNRYGLTDELAIPLDQSWNYLANAIYQAKAIDLFKR